MSRKKTKVEKEQTQAPRRTTHEAPSSYADVCAICELRPDDCTGHTSIRDWNGLRYAARTKTLPKSQIRRIRVG